MAKQPKDDSQPGRIKQMLMVARIVHKDNPKALPLTALAAVAAIAVVIVVGFFLKQLLFTVPLAILVGVAVAMVLFGRFAQKAQYRMLDGQPGASLAILENMRGNWSVNRAVAANRNMDIVHRVIGRPGVVLVGEGDPAGLRTLLAAEKKRVARVLYDVTIYDIQVGDAADQVPIRKLQNHIMKLPSNMSKQQVSEINYRLKALPANMQMPKGPMPKGAKMPKAPKPRMK
ncbi:MAG TPA: DUF4191 domain-containing protein [Streptosporangiaceae bacterium]|jgi:hypothetical protein